MKIRRIIGFTALAALVASAVLCGRAWLTPPGAEPQPPVAGTPADLPASLSSEIARGEYLAKAADCVACHSVSGGTPYAGGRPFKLPFGTIYATNLTPDKDSGIGNWSDDAFVKAVREGIGSHGNLYPAMPYTSYTQLSRDDVLAIKRYLLTLAPVHAAPPANDLSFPYDQRWGMAAWNVLFFHEQRFAADPAKSVEWNRGAYLATALGHCGECHTPRNAGFAMKSRDYLSGADIEGWKAYNTTSDQSYGIGAWSDQQVAQYLSLGHAPGRSSAAGPMADVVEHSLQYLTPGDIAALVAYLRSVAPATGGQASAAATITLDPSAAHASNAVLPGASSTTPALARGQRLFAGDCAGCHQWNGAGRQSDYASLVGSHAVNDPSGAALVQVLLHGTSLTVNGRVQQMPGFEGAYTDSDIAAVANFVLSHFGSKEGAVTAEQVSKLRAAQ
ncbi:cytochrome c [Paraburkholderia sp. J67]|uniref:cytochrome c n=1 Tax=Paraburkholderia sp. J67 TaxID=2805435 RepID=UPI002ABD8F94|nr:cytochrome c [Paraburkholderia sp. J67]